MKYVTSIERIGMQKGMQRGSAALILRQLQRRIGLLDEATQAHIRALPLEQIEKLSDASPDFSALADLQAWLKQHSVLAEIAVRP